MEEKKVMIPWADWEIVGSIGKGGFGSIYEIQRTIRGRTERAALKMITIPKDKSEIAKLRSDGYDDESITQYFADSLDKIENEYAMMADMKGHSNIVYCDDIRTIQHDDGFGWDIYIKMELLTPLKSYMEYSPSEEQVIKMGIYICNALMLCEQLNVVHRDIKPDNILVSRDGTYKLGDFGIAKTMERTTGGTITGTYDYMAPEVYNNCPYHRGVDIYSLGLVMYWLLNERTGPFLPLNSKRPTPSMKQAAWERRFAGESIPNPKHGSDTLKAIVLKACAFDPKDRYQSAQEMLDELMQLKDASTITGIIQNDITNTSSGTKLDYEANDEEETDDNTVVEEYDETEGPGFAQREEHLRKQREEKEHLRKQKEEKHRTWRLLIGTLLVVLVSFLAILIAMLNKINNKSIESTEAIHEHIWGQATCERPATCSSCGVTSGSAQGHQWIDASASSPRTCNTCGRTEGRSLGSPLSQCTVIGDSNDQGSTADVKAGDWIDCFGGTHYEALRFWVVKKSGYTNKEYITYDLKGQYDEMDVSIQLDEKSQTGATAYIRVYLDGQLVETSQVVNKESSAIMFTVSVDTINRVKIECVTDASKHAYCIVDAVLFVI